MNVFYVFSDYVSKLDGDYSDLIQSAYAESTCKNFMSHSMNYIDFCGAHKLQLYPLNMVTVIRYLTHYTQKVGSYSTIANVVSSLTKFYSLSGFKLDVNHPLIDMLLKAAKRTMSNTAKPKSPLQVSHLILIKNVVDCTNVTHHAFIVALVFQFFTCLRKSNLLPVSANLKSLKCIKRSDVLYRNGSLIVMLSWSKTLQNKDDIFQVCIAPTDSHVLNPVRMYMHFIEMFPMPQHFPAFSFKQAGRVFVLTQRVYGQLLKHYLGLIGVPPSSFSSHSVRRGSSSFLFESGCDTHLIKHHGTWKSSAYQRYLTFNHHQRLIPTQKMHDKIKSMFGL